MENDGGKIVTEKTEDVGGKNCPSAILSATNPTRIEPGANSCLRGEWPAANRLSHDTALRYTIPVVLFVPEFYTGTYQYIGAGLAQAV
jgi:hypothetical protein